MKTKDIELLSNGLSIFVKQVDGFRLGNFINCTPSIKAMADKLGYKIPVYFETEYVKKCFLDCPFIEILEEDPGLNPIITSGLVCKANTLPDYVYIFQYIKGLFALEYMPHTYVDKPTIEIEGEKENILFINGTGNQDKKYIASKDPGKAFVSILNSFEAPVYFTGSLADYKRNKPVLKKLKKLRHIFYEDIRWSLALINNASLVVANDTGLAHAAAAMNKPLIILWKDTPFTKNTNPGNRTIYLKKEIWAGL